MTILEWLSQPWTLIFYELQFKVVIKNSFLSILVFYCEHLQGTWKWSKYVPIVKNEVEVSKCVYDPPKIMSYLRYFSMFAQAHNISS